RRLSATFSAPSEPEVHAGRAIAGQVIVGTLSGAILAVGGAFAAGSMPCDGDECHLGQAAFGFLIGESVGVPLGVYGMGQHRGRSGYEILASTAITVGGIVATQLVHDPSPLLLIPPVQLIATIAIDRVKP